MQVHALTSQQQKSELERLIEEQSHEAAQGNTVPLEVEPADADLEKEALLEVAEASEETSTKAVTATKEESSKEDSKKKSYTEDSIRLYLQEIGRIRLLRADEEIELARKIADLLELERKRTELEATIGCEPTDEEWAQEVDMPLQKFRRRLMLGRRAKEKMVQSNLRLVVSIA
ncbi:MAG: sigma-70 factor domain-containing protein, partial [Halothece sp. Uz-M2-17]|nr:sigma-70 factor domain-containing protein [Halothece sp. Uz-M2-17]